MGNDGGSVSTRGDLVKVKTSTEKADPDTERLTQWTTCALSLQPLREPIVSDKAGRMMNKEALLEYLLSRSSLSEGRREHKVAGHIRTLKDVVQLKLSPNPDYRPPSPSEPESTTAPFACPLTAREMNGKYPFVYLRSCGCVMSENGLRAVAAAPKGNNKKMSAHASDKSSALSCPVCGTEAEGSLPSLEALQTSTHGPVRLINPPDMERRTLKLMQTSTKASKPISQGAKPSKDFRKVERQAERLVRLAELTAEFATGDNSLAAPPQKVRRHVDLDTESVAPPAKKAKAGSQHQ